MVSTMHPTDSATTPFPAGRQAAPLHDLRPAPDLVAYASEYARQRPDVVALWCFGIGFMLGWKLKPW